MNRTVCVSVSLLAVLAASCGPQEDEAGEATIPQWTATPDLRIGSIDDPDYSLTFFTQMTVGSDGAMYTVHAREQLIRVFNEDGSLRGTIGGEGDGPGEFRGLTRVGWVGDTLWAFDFRGSMFSHFGLDATYLGGFSVPFASADFSGPQPPRASGRLFDGTVHGAPLVPSHQVAAGLITHDQPMLMTRAGETTDTLPEVLLGRNQWAISHPDGAERGGMYMRQPFGDGPLWGYANRERALFVVDRVVRESTDMVDATVTKISFTGDTLYSAAHSFPGLPVTESEADSIIADIGDRIGERGLFGATVRMGREWARTSLFHPPFRPAVASMVIAQDDAVWLRLSAPRDAIENEWLVIGSDGQPMGSMTLPGDVNVLRIDPPYLWASQQDDFDVPYLLRFTISTS